MRQVERRAGAYPSKGTKYRIDVDCVVLVAQTRKIALKFDKTQGHTNGFLNPFLSILQVSLPLTLIYGRYKSDRNHPTVRPIKVQIRSDFFYISLNIHI